MNFKNIFIKYNRHLRQSQYDAIVRRLENSGLPAYGTRADYPKYMECEDGIKTDHEDWWLSSDESGTTRYTTAEFITEFIAAEKQAVNVQSMDQWNFVTEKEGKQWIRDHHELQYDRNTCIALTETTFGSASCYERDGTTVISFEDWEAQTGNVLATRKFKKGSIRFKNADGQNCIEGMFSIDIPSKFITHGQVFYNNDYTAEIVDFHKDLYIVKSKMRDDNYVQFGYKESDLVEISQIDILWEVAKKKFKVGDRVLSRHSRMKENISLKRVHETLPDELWVSNTSDTRNTCIYSKGDWADIVAEERIIDTEKNACTFNVGDWIFDEEQGFALIESIKEGSWRFKSPGWSNLARICNETGFGSIIGERCRKATNAEVSDFLCGVAGAAYKRSVAAYADDYWKDTPAKEHSVECAEVPYEGPVAPMELPKMIGEAVSTYDGKNPMTVFNTLTK